MGESWSIFGKNIRLGGPVKSISNNCFFTANKEIFKESINIFINIFEIFSYIIS